MKRLIRIALILAVGVYTCSSIIRQVDHETIFDTLTNFVLSVLALGIFVWTIFKDREEYRRHKRLTAFMPTALGVLMGMGLGVTLFLLQQRDRSPVKLYCVSKIVDFNGVSIDFREDGTYKLTNWCMGADYYRGTYTMTGNTIVLDKNHIENVLESNRLFIQQDGAMDDAGNRERSIYQVDKNGHVIKRAVDFRVQDNPKR
jgi:hypothetical protein